MCIHGVTIEMRVREEFPEFEIFHGKFCRTNFICQMFIKGAAIAIDFVANAMPTMIVEEELRELDRFSIFLRNSIRAGICGLNLYFTKWQQMQIRYS